MPLRGPATQIQKNVARRLGIEFDETITWGELHLLIVKAKPEMLEADRPSEIQVAYARSLGIEVNGTEVTGAYLSALIEDTITTKSRQLLGQNPALKEKNVVRCLEGVYEIRKIGIVAGRPWRVMLIPVAGTPGNRRIVALLELADAKPFVED